MKSGISFSISFSVSNILYYRIYGRCSVFYDENIIKLGYLKLFGLARRGSAIGFHLLWHTVELAMSTRLCLL